MASQTFSCVNCGNSYEIHSPQTDYDTMRLEKCKGESEDHNITMTVDCENCHETTPVYWCAGWHSGDSKIIS